MGVVQDMTNGAAIDVNDNCLFIYSRPLNDIRLYYELEHYNKNTKHLYKEEFYDMER
jgi:hypothetical protein